MSGTEHGEAPSPDLEDSIALIIEKALTNLEERGIIVPFCDSHDRAFAVEAVEGGEICEACHGEGFSGELCHLGCDSVGYELAAKIMKLVNPPRCTCDDHCDGPCPVHHRENALQDRLASALESLRGMREERDEALLMGGVADRMLTATYDAVYSGEPSDEREVRWKWVLLGIKHMREDNTTMRGLLMEARKYVGEIHPDELASRIDKAITVTSGGDHSHG